MKSKQPTLRKIDLLIWTGNMLDCNGNKKNEDLREAAWAGADALQARHNQEKAIRRLSTKDNAKAVWQLARWYRDRARSSRCTDEADLYWRVYWLLLTVAGSAKRDRARAGKGGAQ